MKTSSKIITALLGLSLLSACDGNEQTSSFADKVSSNITAEIDKAKVDISNDTKAIDIALKGDKKASIAVNGDLMIDGKNQALTAEQRELTKAYYQSMKTLALQGVEMGKEGVKLAGEALGMAIDNIFSDKAGKDGKDIDKNIEAKAGKIKIAAQKLCDSALELKTIQQKLSEAVPAFNPEPIEVNTKDDGCEIHSNNDAGINADLNVDMDSNP